MRPPRSSTNGNGPERAMVVALALAAIVAGCGNAVTPSQPGFCRRVTANLEALRNVGDASQSTRTLDAYRKVAAVAPAGVRDAWATLTALIEAAAANDLTQPGADAAFAQRILASKPAFDDVITYTRDNCGIDLAAPPPTTAPPTTPAPVTTLPPPPETTTPETTTPDTTATETTAAETTAPTTSAAETTAVNAPATTTSPTAATTSPPPTTVATTTPTTATT